MTVAVALYVGLMYIALGLFVIVTTLLEHRRPATRMSNTVGGVLGGVLALLLGFGVLRFGQA